MVLDFVTECYGDDLRERKLHDFFNKQLPSSSTGELGKYLSRGSSMKMSRKAKSWNVQISYIGHDVWTGNSVGTFAQLRNWVHVPNPKLLTLRTCPIIILKKQANADI